MTLRRRFSSFRIEQRSARFGLNSEAQHDRFHRFDPPPRTHAATLDKMRSRWAICSAGASQDAVDVRVLCCDVKAVCMHLKPLVQAIYLDMKPLVQAVYLVVKPLVQAVYLDMRPLVLAAWTSVLGDISSNMF